MQFDLLQSLIILLKEQRKLLPAEDVTIVMLPQLHNEILLTLIFKLHYKVSDSYKAFEEDLMNSVSLTILNRYLSGYSPMKQTSWGHLLYFFFIFTHFFLPGSFKGELNDSQFEVIANRVKSEKLAMMSLWFRRRGPVCQAQLSKKNHWT